MSQMNNNSNNQEQTSQINNPQRVDNVNNQNQNQNGNRNNVNMNNVLDSVLENIDGLLMESIPPNPALTPLPPIPPSSQYTDINNTNDDMSSFINNQFYLQQSINNNELIMTNNNNINNINDQKSINELGNKYNNDHEDNTNNFEQQSPKNNNKNILLIGSRNNNHQQQISILNRQLNMNMNMYTINNEEQQMQHQHQPHQQQQQQPVLPSIPVIPPSIFNDYQHGNNEIQQQQQINKINELNHNLQEMEHVINEQYHLAQQINNNFGVNTGNSINNSEYKTGSTQDHENLMNIPQQIRINPLSPQTLPAHPHPQLLNQHGHQQHFKPPTMNTMHHTHHHARNNNNNDQHQHRSFMTPSSSYNSLISLTSNHSATSNRSNDNNNINNNINNNNTRETEINNNHNNNNNNNDREYHQRRNKVLYNGFSTKIVVFDGMDDKSSKNNNNNNNNHISNNKSNASSSSLKLQLKDYVFISKDCTSRLGQYIVKENWGRDYGLLYKYLDYIFRCQAFKKQTIVINNKYLIFHSGLQRRSDKQFLFCLLVPNKKYVAQKWRVQFGNIKNSFVSKSELLSKIPESYLITDYLPKRTRFFSDLSELLYDESYSIEVNWEERLTTNKDRICRVLGNLAFFDQNSKFMKLTELIEAFDISLKQTQKIAALNPRLAVAQGFIDTKHCKYRMELLLPLIIEFPKYSASYFIFALAIGKSTEQERKYTVKSILTMDMAYANARLVGYVDSSWLYYGENNHKRMDINDFFSRK